MQSIDSVTYQSLVDTAKQTLYSSSDTPRIDAEVLIGHVVKQSLSWLISRGDQPASADHIEHFERLVTQRKQGQPIAYLIGERDFWTLTLSVDENVLIPRPDTETLVDAALDCLNAKSKTSNQALSILDLGTGSGAIALALGKELPNAKVIAIDYHLNALNVAKRNALTNNINNVKFIQSHWFDEVDSTQRFDLIASNPPYIEEDDPHLIEGDLRFEPSTALVSADRGLSDLNQIIKRAPDFLQEQGYLIVEHGYNQDREVADLFTRHGFSDIKLHRDLSNLPRCTIGQFSPS